MLPALQQKADKILLVGTDRPADEGNILWLRRTSDSIRWIVYELRDGKVEPGAWKGSPYAALRRQNLGHANEACALLFNNQIVLHLKYIRYAVGAQSGEVLVRVVVDYPF